MADPRLARQVEILRANARRYPGAIEKLRRLGYTEAADALQELLETEAEVLEVLEGALQGGSHSGNHGDVVTARTKVRISLRAIAEAVGVSHAYLSQCKAGKKRIKRSLAKRIAAITADLPATEKTWPKGWARE